MGAKSMTPTKDMSPKHKRIIDLLTAEDLTIRQAAQRLGVTISSVYYACRKYKHKRHNKRHKRIIDLLTAEDLTIRQAAERLGMSTNSVSYACHKYKLKYVNVYKRNRKTSTASKKISPTHKRVIDLLTAEDLTIPQATQRLGLSRSIVAYACQKYKLKYVNAHRNRIRIPELMDREWLYQKVTVEGLSCPEVADLLGCSRQYVHQRVVLMGIRRDAPAAPTKLAGSPVL